MRDLNYKFAFKQKKNTTPPETIFTSAINFELKIVTGIHQLYAVSENSLVFLRLLDEITNLK